MGSSIFLLLLKPARDSASSRGLLRSSYCSVCPAPLMQPLCADLLDHLPSLLYSYWTLATAAAAFTLTPGDSCSAFRRAVKLSAARGKLCSSPEKAQLGWLTNLQVPQRWFLHFYVAGTACNSALLFAAWPGFASTGLSNEQVVSLLSLTLLEVHLVRRMLETAYIMQYPEDAKMHLIAYVFGLSYYVVLPLSCLPAASITERTEYADGNSTADWRTVAIQSQHILGAGVFLAGNVLQFWSHWILASLRRSIPKSTRNQKEFYQTPTGGPFHWVSCPHYLAEIIIYMGLAILARDELPLTILILCWVVTNLLLAAQPTHLWYQQHFADYPKDRKALIPYLY